MRSANLIKPTLIASAVAAAFYLASASTTGCGNSGNGHGRDDGATDRVELARHTAGLQRAGRGQRCRCRQHRSDQTSVTRAAQFDPDSEAGNC